jgi:lipopolysaccharide/colanic/teichoic acid biosynthesis glycosyltransferase
MPEKVSYLELTSPALKGGQFLAKRLIDLVGSGIGLLVLSPLFAVVALLIKIDSPGPVLFSQIRVGQGGRRFKILKFRTMAEDADETKEALQHLNQTGDPRFFKIPDDPRVNRIGAFLRAWSLDELPQLWNVFRGDMSLVGPRPFPESDLRDYLDHHFDRLAVRPGITGLWQVGGRSEVESFDEVVRLDREYIDTWTLGLDLAILLRTIPAVLGKRGAH